MPVSGINGFTLKTSNEMNNYSSNLSSTTKQVTNTYDLNKIPQGVINDNKVEEFSFENENSQSSNMLNFVIEPIKKYNEKLSENIQNLSEEEQKQILEKRLQELYVERDKNNGFFHPIIENGMQEEIELLEKELGVPHKADKWEKTWKTGKYAVNSFVEGAVSVGENVRDFVELHGTDLMGKAMMKVGYIDQEIYDEMMEETKANIAINYVKDSADIINEEQGLTGNVYHEETVRGIGNGIGRTAEIVGLSLAGGHIASTLGASTGATGAATTAANSSKIASVGTKIANAMTKSETYSRLARWAIAGFSGAGEELQTAFQNGATLAEAKKASYIKGTWDAFQWAVGEGINGFNPLKNQFANSALHVGLDAMDGGAEGFVQPAIQQIYMDGTYSEIFNANGGWVNVGTQAAVGGIMSTAGEIGQNVNFKNIENLFKHQKISENFDGNNLPLSNNPGLLNVQKKMLNGEKLSVREKVKLRDHVETKINAYDLKSDHAYRVINDVELEKCLQKGKIFVEGKEEFIKYSDGTTNNGGCDWYLGGYSNKYGKGGITKTRYIIESPADKKYFTLAHDNGNGMTDSVHVRHIKSSNGENAIPIDKISKLFRINENGSIIEINIKSLIDSKKNSIYNIDDPELELSFFDGNNSKINFINKLKHASNYTKDTPLTLVQKSYVDDINNFLKTNGAVDIKLNNTSQLTSKMLTSIDDLSKVRVIVSNSFSDINGNYKTKYNDSKYIERITYSGYEMLSILKKLEYLESMVDMSLPIKQRAHQIYEILASEIPVMRDFGKYAEGHKVSASLRGITSYNSVGKEGLVCAGYASAFKELCDRCNIPCEYIRGKATLDPLTGKYGSHAWNVVIDENNDVIPVDVTWKASGGKEWFGKSEPFAAKHIADADENFTSYSPSVKHVKNLISENDFRIQNIVDIINQKYGQGSGINAIENYMKTKDLNYITRTGNARSMIEQIDQSDLEKYMLKNSINYRYNQLAEIEYLLDQKFGAGEGRTRLIEYVNTGNVNLITRTNNARESIQLISRDDIIKYINGGF